jgi:hypothetical protein
MTVLDLIVIVTAILFFVRWKMSKLSFHAYLFNSSLHTYLVKCFYLIFLLGYALHTLIIRVDWSFIPSDFLNYRIF